MPDQTKSAEESPFIEELRSSTGVAQEQLYRRDSYRDVLVVLVACLGPLSMGLVLGYTNPALQDENLVRLLQDSEKATWFGSLVAVGAIFGSHLAGFLAARVGRKLTLMLCTVLMGMGWLMIVCGSEFILMYCGRILTGFSSGMICFVVPLYIAEVASKSRRGILGAGFQLFGSTGILLVYVIGGLLSWIWLAVACLGVSTLNILLLLFVAETPRWYLMKKRREAALESLAWFLGGDDDAVKKEIDEIDRNLSALQATGSMSFRDLFQSEVYKPMLISFGMMFFQQMTGINVVIFYSSNIFATAGFSEDPQIPTILIGAVLVAATIISCVLMDRAGRRVLLLISSIVTTLSLFALGTYYYIMEFYEVSVNLSWLSLTSVLVFVVFFSLGWGPIPWIIIFEIIPPRARSIVGGLTTSFLWIFVFVITKEFDRIRKWLNDFGAFWFFGGFCLLSCIFVGVFVPETKGRSLEEIQKQFSISIPSKDLSLSEMKVDSAAV